MTTNTEASKHPGLSLRLSDGASADLPIAPTALRVSRIMVCHDRTYVGSMTIAASRFHGVLVEVRAIDPNWDWFAEIHWDRRGFLRYADAYEDDVFVGEAPQEVVEAAHVHALPLLENASK